MSCENSRKEVLQQKMILFERQLEEVVLGDKVFKKVTVGS